jgi:hypothetical protein
LKRSMRVALDISIFLEIILYPTTDRQLI